MIDTIGNATLLCEEWQDFPATHLRLSITFYRAWRPDESHLISPQYPNEVVREETAIRTLQLSAMQMQNEWT